jgi:hypothetical protein
VETRFKVARILVTIAAAFIAVGPPLADFNASHVLNPLWIGHARLHTVWLVVSNSLVSLVAIGLLWRPFLGSIRSSVLLGAVLVGAILVGFLVAAATQLAYDGSLTDPNGVTLTAGPVDANLAAFSVLLCLVVAALALARKPEA